MVAPSIGPYRILEKLGAGGMGEVYLAEDSRLGRKVAIKTLLPSRLENPDARRRLLNEARTAATLNHPNIAAIYDVVETDDRMHIVMEYAQGETLSARIHRGSVRPAAVLEIALQLTDALAAAHEAGIVHRDLKSDNVLIMPSGRLKILDFGLARTHSPIAIAGPDDTTPSGTRSISGTPPYMSPEQLLGNRIDQRSDIYSLGIVMFELLTGRRPYQARDGIPLAQEILTRRTPTAREVNPYVPEELSAIVARAMAREPAARYQSAQEMRADLNRLSAVISDRPTVSHPAEWSPPSPRAPTQPSRRPSLLAGAAAIAAAVIALLALRPLAGRGSASGGDGGSGAPPVVAVLPFVNLSGDRSDEPLGAGIADVLVSKLSRLSGVALLPLSATQPYHGKANDPKRVASDLGANYVVEGGVQRAGQHLRVTATLVEGASGRVAWSDDFDATSADLFALQHQLADGLAGALRLRLTPAERQKLARPPTSNVEAFAEYSQARSFLERPDVPGNTDRALQLLQSAIAKDPRFALAHGGLGEAYWAKWEQTKDDSWTVKARDQAAEALRLDPEQPDVRVSLALTYKSTGRPQEAMEELQRALALQPNSDSARRLLGQLFLEQGRRTDAVEQLRAAIAIRPNYWENHIWLGRAFYDQGLYDDAIKAFRRVTELQPDNSRGFQGLGAVYQASGRNSEAVANYERALAIHADSRAYSNLATVHYREGRFAEAVQAYERAVELEPGSPVLHRNLGDAYLRVSQPARARGCFTRAADLARTILAVNPSDSQTISLLAVVEAKLGRPAEAERHALEAATLAPSSALVLYRQAVVGALTGRDSDALEALSRALKLGYSISEARQDDDLASLRHRADFRSLLAAGA